MKGSLGTLTGTFFPSQGGAAAAPPTAPTEGQGPVFGGSGCGMPRCICTALETTANQSCLPSAVFGSGFLQEALEGLWAFISSKAEGPPALAAPGP